jgi:hypothetical protein
MSPVTNCMAGIERDLAGQINGIADLDRLGISTDGGGSLARCWMISRGMARAPKELAMINGLQGSRSWKLERAVTGRWGVGR